MPRENVDLLKLVKGGDIIPRFVSNGFDIGEIEETLEGIHRTEDWAPEWARLGERHAGLAETALRAGHALTAGETLIRASLCHHYAQFLSFEANEEKRGNQEKKIALYTRALPLVDPPIEKVRIPFEGVSLPGYFRVPQAGARPRACVVFIEGTDSTKEESYYMGNEFLRRGMATLAFDGPGQGETFYFMKMRSDFEKATEAAIDFLAGRPEVDAARIGILGRSFGGHLAPRSAAHDSRIRACVSMGGYFDTSFYRWEEPLRRIRFQFICGKESLEETKAVAARFTLSGRADRIQCPVLAVHGERDHGVPREQAEKIVRGCAGEATLLSLPTGNHVCHNMTRYVFAHVSDWMADRLGKEAGT